MTYNHKLNKQLTANSLPRERDCEKLTEFSALLMIHQLQQKKGQFYPAILDEAQKVVNSMETDSETQIEAFRNLIAALASSGRDREAENLSQQINKHPVVKAKELRKLATALIMAGDIFAEDAQAVFSEAEDFARAIKHPETKVKALRELAAALAKARYIHKALALSNECDALNF